MALSNDQVKAYNRNGYLFPLKVLDNDEIRHCLDALGRLEQTIPGALTDQRWRAFPHLYLPWMDELVRHPRIIDIVADILGPDILVFGSTFFVKQPESPAFTAWHQDSTYFGLNPHDQLTAWIALTDVTLAAGCLEVLPLGATPRQLRHESANLEHSLNSGGQVIVEPLDEAASVPMLLPPGSMSLHNTLVPHRSGPNTSATLRIGIGIQYVPAHVGPAATCSYRMPALLVRGQDRFGHYDLLPPPSAELDAAAREQHRKVHSRFYHEIFLEQYVHHSRTYSAPHHSAKQ